jgi:hypothetical protein
MDKVKQKKFAKTVCNKLEDSGTKLTWFLKAVGMSRPHWHYVRKGERPLSENIKNKIIEVLNSKNITV